MTLFLSFQALANSKVVQLDVEGAIHEGTVQTIDQALTFAKDQKAQALLITLDTPGGMLESTRKIVKTFLNETQIPIIVYVSPTGSRAGSAGTFITLAAHVAAMA
ncbi:MAG: nodulation protein NfeD, partial [Bdellovibrionota bacterium]